MSEHDPIEILQRENTRLRALVVELKEALGTLMDVQNGPPLYTWTDRWNDAMAQAKAARKGLTMMKLLVSGATKDVAIYPECGVLVTPRSGNSVVAISGSGRLWAADNDAFSSWSNARFWDMALRISHVNLSNFLWIVCPDVVGNAQETINRWFEWYPQLDYLNLNVAFVGQNGLEDIADQIPWDEMFAFFLGGDTTWKFGEAAEQFAREAKLRGKWLHMGRVNSSRRIRHALEIGTDSIDGGGFSQWPKRIPKGLRWIREHKQRPSLF